LHVLILSQYFWPEGFRVNDLALGLQERGHRVTVLTGLPNYPGGALYPGYGPGGPWREDYHGVEVIRVPLLARGQSKGIRLALNYLSFVVSASILGPLRCRGRFDVVFVFEPSPITVGIPALALKAAKGIPVMLWVLDLWPESLSATGAVTSTWVLNQVRRMVRSIYRGCDWVLVSSRGFIERVQEVGARPDRVLYFPQWAESLYNPIQVDKDAPELGQLPAGFRVMFAGNIGAAQGVPSIVSAAEKLREYPNIHWVILGDGRMRGWVEEQVRELGLESTFHLLGRHPMEAMPRFFAMADALLLPLKQDPIFALTVPAKVQSYLACAKPVIASMDGEGAHIVQESRAGLACPAEDPDALAEAVLTMYRMAPAEREAMGLRARSYYETHFEREMLLDRLVGWMEDTARRHRMEAAIEKT